MKGSIANAAEGLNFVSKYFIPLNIATRKKIESLNLTLIKLNFLKYFTQRDSKRETENRLRRVNLFVICRTMIVQALCH